MYLSVGKHALKFMINFWIIGLIILPYGVISGVFSLDIRFIIDSIFGISDIVMEWWFIPQYIVLLSIAPAMVYLLNRCRDRSRNYLWIIPTAIIITISFVYLANVFIGFFGLYIIDISNIIYTYLIYFTRFDTFLTFAVGIICAKFSIFNCISDFKHTKLISYLLILLSISIRVIFLNSPDSMKYDFIVVPLFVFGITEILYNTNISKYIIFFSKHSTNMWLTHTFLCYYYFQGIIMKPYYSTLIYLWLLFLSVLTSYLINLLYIPIYNKLFSKDHKFSYKNYLFFKKRKYMLK